MPRANLSADVVVRAAADLADRDGLDSVTVSGLARHFGVQPASMYSHVRDHAAILDGVQTLALAELADLVADAVAGRSGRDALTALAQAQRDYARKSPGRWTSLPRRPSDRTAHTSGATRLTALTFAVLRGYGIEETELVHATRMLGSCVNGFIALEDAGSFENRSPSIDTSWRRCLAALDTTMRTWSSLSDERTS